MIKSIQGEHMNGKDMGEMPILFKMALSTDINAFRRFLNLNDETQSSIIRKSEAIRSVTEMRDFVSSIPNVNIM